MEGYWGRGSLRFHLNYILGVMDWAIVLRLVRRDYFVERYHQVSAPLCCRPSHVHSMYCHPHARQVGSWAQRTMSYDLF